MFFSIIIPTYNREKHILKTLDSVFNQKYSKYEIIVVDNCSTDNTRQLLQPLIDENKIQFIQHDKNYERAKSRNTGMNIAKGDFVTFLDSDDIMYKNCLSDAFDFSTKNTKYNFFHNHYEFINENGESFYHYKTKLTNDHLKNIVTGNYLACIGVFISKKIYNKHRFDENRELTGSEDWDFWLRVSADEVGVGEIKKINSAIVDHPGRTMNNINIKQLIIRVLYILDKIDNNSNLHQKYLTYLNYLKASSYLLIATNAAANHKKHAVKYLLKAIQLDNLFIFKIRSLIVIKNILFK
tara:strand:+ start:232 stop:1119 length:888 start_codon:yes stop_codon:yes gene_type:complete